ncbi:hypothetical protein Hanom_Chr09g00764511 [Helianthus anomalus]
MSFSFGHSTGMWSSTKSSHHERSKVSRFGVIPRLMLLTLEELRLKNFSFGHSTGMWSSTKSSQSERSNFSRLGVIPRLKLLTFEELRSMNLSLGHSTGMWSTCAKASQPFRFNVSRYGHPACISSSTKTSHCSRCNVSRFGVIPRSNLIKSERLRLRNLSLLRTYHKEKIG